MSADIPLDVIMFVDELATYGKTGYVYNNDDIFAKTVRYKIALQNRATRDLVLEKVNQTANFEIFKNFCVNAAFFDGESASGIDSIESAIKSTAYLKMLVDNRDDPTTSDFLMSILANETYRGYLDSIAETRSATTNSTPTDIHENCKPLSVPAIITKITCNSEGMSAGSCPVTVNGQTYHLSYGSSPSGRDGVTKSDSVYHVVLNQSDIWFSGQTHYSHDSDSYAHPYSWIYTYASYVYL